MCKLSPLLSGECSLLPHPRGYSGSSHFAQRDTLPDTQLIGVVVDIWSKQGQSILQDSGTKTEIEAQSPGANDIPHNFCIGGQISYYVNKKSRGSQPAENTERRVTMGRETEGQRGWKELPDGIRVIGKYNYAEKIWEQLILS